MTFSRLSQLTQLAGQNGLKKVANTDGGEWTGGCPKCGGSDRFHVWPEKDRFWCRRCEAKGDSIAYLQWTEGKTFREACQIVGKVLKRRGLKPITQDWREEISLTPPSQRVVVTEPKEIETTVPGGSPAILDDIQIDAPTEPPAIVETVEETPVTTGAAIPDPEVITPLPEPISNEALTQQWRDMDLLAMIPLGQRDEAAAILLDDPNSRQILELCRLGVYDCYVAMEKLGLPDPYLGDLNIQPGPLSEDHIEPTAWTGELPPPCLNCDHHFNGWCKNVPGSTGYNVKFIQRCVGELPERFVETQQY